MSDVPDDEAIAVSRCPRPVCPQMLDCITFPCDTCPSWATADEEEMG